MDDRHVFSVQVGRLVYVVNMISQRDCDHSKVYPALLHLVRDTRLERVPLMETSDVTPVFERW